MAIFHLSANTGSRAQGQSALAKASYVIREGAYSDSRDPVVYTYSGNLPPFAASDPLLYWSAADEFERANGRLFKEVEVALPVELDLKEHVELVHAFVPQLLGGEVLPYSFGIHAGGGANPHCHILISERVNDRIQRPVEQWFKRFKSEDPARGGARKTEALKPKAWLHSARKTWADLVNRALARAGFLERVDHRSLKVQGIDRIPGVHLGPNVYEMENRDIATGRGDLSHLSEVRRDRIQNLELAAREIERASSTHVQNAARSKSSSTVRGSTGRGDGQTTRSDLPLREPTAPKTESVRSPKEHSSSAHRDPRRLPMASSQSAELSPESTSSSERNALRTAAVARAEGTQAAVPIGATGTREPDNETDAPVSRSVSNADSSRTASFDASHEASAEPRTSELSPSDLEPPSPDPAENLGSESGGGLSAESTDGHGLDPHAPSQQFKTAGLSSEDTSKRPRTNSGPSVAADLTARAVSRQLRAMGCETFELRIFNRSNGSTLIRRWTPSEVIDRLGWIKAMNARGSDILVRPTRNDAHHGLVLLDGLDRKRLRGLIRDGLDPAAIVETSPGNLQAWIRLASSLEPAIRAELATRLAHDYAIGPGNDQANPFGRLAGFTNREPRHRDSVTGVHPFALLRGASGRAAPSGVALVRLAERERDARTTPRPPEQPAHAARPTELESPRTTSPDRAPSGSPGALAEAMEIYRGVFYSMHARRPDPSACDFAAALRLANRGFDTATIAETIRAVSPELEQRKPGRVENYIRRTANAAARTSQRQQTRNTPAARASSPDSDPGRTPER